VIVPTLTFCSTANVVVHLGARPILIDVNEDFNISIEALDSAISSRTKAIMPVHYGGQACDLDSIHDLANSHDLIVVEDAAHAVGADYRGRKIGSDALRSSLSRSDSQAERCMSVFSFYAIKNMTTGEGGMIATSNDNLAKQFRLLAMHGMSRDSWNRYTSAGSWHYEVVMAGYKCNMTDIQASLGIHQLRKLDGFINRRTHLAQLYSEAFADVPELDIPIVHDHRKHAWHLYVIRLRTGMLRINRAQFIDELKSRNIGTSVHFIPVHLHPFYQRTFAYRMGDFPVAESIYERIVSLPLYPQMTDQDVTYVADSVLDLVKQYRK
jgi:dTDP-4-amino-4,6-dideoxygalactose transaminase